MQDHPAFADAMDRYGEMVSRGGETIEDTAARERGLRSIQGRLSGQQAAMREEFAARGQGGGQMELAARLGAQEQAADTGSQLALDTQAQLQRRALEALKARTGLASDQFSRDVTRAQARDVLRNENKRLGRQRTEDLNRINQQQFGNRVTRMQGETGQTVNVANATSQAGAGAAQQIGAAGLGAGQIIQGAARAGNAGAPPGYHDDPQTGQLVRN